jgi:pSer/pThr/pTyr-binding forkhead associated (FHA) protein
MHPAPGPAPAAAEGLRCTRCGATNAAGMRFCITCGSPLAVAPTPVVPAPVAVPAASPIAPAAVPAIAPAPVVGLSGGAAAPETQTCKRCQGQSDKNAQFCRFCGAPLGEVPAAAPPPIRTLPSAPAVRLDSTVATGAPQVTEAPAPKPQPVLGRLVVIQKDGGEGESFPLGEQLDVGRVEGGAIFADDRYMAPRHARLTFKEGKLSVRDLGTPNGVYLRLRKEPDSTVLEDQDLILLGQQVLRFEIVKDAEAGLGAASEQGTLLFGTPAGPRYARLCQRTTEGVACDVFHVRKAETVLGRESGDIVFPDDPFLSRRHATVRAIGEQGSRRFTLADLGSSNGTFIRIRGEVALRQGDEIRVGQQLLRVDLGGPANAVKGSS